MLAAITAKLLFHEVLKTTGRAVVIEPVGAMSAENDVFGIMIAALAAKLHSNSLSTRETLYAYQYSGKKPPEKRPSTTQREKLQNLSGSDHHELLYSNAHYLF